MPVPLALAIAGIVIGTAQLGASIAGGITGKARADRANNLRKKLLEITHAEDKFQLEKRLEAVLGTQRASYGARGVEVAAGTPEVIRRETMEAGARARRNLAFSYVYERKGGGSPKHDVGSYFGQAAGIATSAYSSGAFGNKPTTVTKPKSSAYGTGFTG